MYSNRYVLENDGLRNGYRTLSTVYYFSSAGETCDVVLVHDFDITSLVWILCFGILIYGCRTSSAEPASFVDTVHWTTIWFQFELLLVENSPTPPRRPRQLGGKTNVCRLNGCVFESPFRQTILNERQIEKTVDRSMLTIYGFVGSFTWKRKWRTSQRLPFVISFWVCKLFFVVRGDLWRSMFTIYGFMGSFTYSKNSELS
jgi:hypothetical protein